MDVPPPPLSPPPPLPSIHVHIKRLNLSIFFFGWFDCVRTFAFSIVARRPSHSPAIAVHLRAHFFRFILFVQVFFLLLFLFDKLTNDKRKNFTAYEPNCVKCVRAEMADVRWSARKSQCLCLWLCEPALASAPAIKLNLRPPSPFGNYIWNYSFER